MDRRIFTFVSMVHLYWAAGGKLGSLAAIPQLPGEFASGPRLAFKPSALGTLLVAMGLVAIALLVCLRAGLYFRRCPMAHCNGASARLP